MKKIWKITGRIFLVTALLLGGFIAVAYISFYRKANRNYSFQAESGVRFDTALLQRGRHLVAIKGCNQCHGNNLAGKILEDDPLVGRIVAPNLTTGEGGLPSNYTLQDWTRALQHGVNREGKPLKFMPSNETATLTLEDMCAVITYCKTVQPVDRSLPALKTGPLLKVLTLFDKVPVFSVEMIDHEKTLHSQPAHYLGKALGQYLSISCAGCHRPDMNGGDAFVPGGLPAPAITASGRVGQWTEMEFMNVLKTGKTPEGEQLDSLAMPWNMTALYSDEELRGLYEYLRSIR